MPQPLGRRGKIPHAAPSVDREGFGKASAGLKSSQRVVASPESASAVRREVRDGLARPILRFHEAEHRLRHVAAPDRMSDDDDVVSGRIGKAGRTPDSRSAFARSTVAQYSAG